MIQLLVLAGVAVFLILKLRSVLGTRDGFEKPPAQAPAPQPARTHAPFEVIEGGPDRDITDHVDENSRAAQELAAMKLAEPGFSVSEFLGGARGAYEMILMAFERGEIDDVRSFLSPEVAAAFDGVVADRVAAGHRIEAEFHGLRDLEITEAAFNRASNEGEITMRFDAELSSAVLDAAGEVIEGDPNAITRQRDIWTFAREMGAEDPNWRLVATGA